jgi:hypothetical protein
MTSARRVLCAALFWIAGCGDDSGSSSGAADAGVDAAIGCRVYRDADGDGVGGEAMAVECDSAPPSGYVAEGGDCDDSDAAVFVAYYMDYDRDGVGTEDMQVCAGSSAPSHTSERAGDCDDNDRYIHSEAAEPFDDGEDFDCNGEEKPACALLNEHDPDSPGLALDPTCQGADLYVAEVFRCYDAGCGDRHAFTVGNRGALDLTDAIEVGFRTPDELTMVRYVTLLSEDIPPDGRSAPIRMPLFEPGTVLIELGADGTDCSIGNNVTVVEVDEVDCRQ